MQIKWLRKALRDLDSEARHIAAENPAAAHLVVGRVLETVARLAQQPRLGRPGRVLSTRELIVEKTRYIVPYRVRGETIEVLRVFYNAPRLSQ